jgi:hypothetical protein
MWWRPSAAKYLTTDDITKIGTLLLTAVCERTSRSDVTHTHTRTRHSIAGSRSGQERGRLAPPAGRCHCRYRRPPITRYPRESLPRALTYAPCAEVARNRDAIVAMMPVHRVEAAFAVSLRRFVSPDGTVSK